MIKTTANVWSLDDEYYPDFKYYTWKIFGWSNKNLLDQPQNLIIIRLARFLVKSIKEFVLYNQRGFVLIRFGWSKKIF